MSSKGQTLKVDTLAQSLLLLLLIPINNVLLQFHILSHIQQNGAKGSRPLKIELIGRAKNKKFLLAAANAFGHIFDMSLQLNIEKLKGLDNYKAWSMTVRAYLESEDLWSVVEHGPENNEESQLKDKRAKFIILCLIETKLCQFMVSIRTARDLWNYLRQQHSLR